MKTLIFYEYLFVNAFMKINSTLLYSGQKSGLENPGSSLSPLHSVVFVSFTIFHTSCKNNKYFVVLLSNIRTSVNIFMRGNSVRNTGTEHLGV